MEQKDRNSLTQDRLKALLSYDADTGVFHWLVNRRGAKTKAGERADARIATDGQRYITVDGSIQSASRLAWLYVFGAWPARTLRHRNDNSASNAIGNLYEFEGPVEGRELTHERLLEMLHYDAETGVFTWRRRVGNVAAGATAGRVWGSNGYRFMRLDSTDYTAAQLAWFYVKGEMPKGPVRFQDGDQTNLRFDNLFPARWLGTKHDYKTPEGRRSYGQAHRAAHPDHYRDFDLQRTFGISLVDYERMLAEQNGVCAICGCGETVMRGGRVKNLAVDHDHATGVVRSLVCQAHNQMLGFAGDSPELLEAAAAYLRRHTEKAALAAASNVVPIRSA